ncbi:transposase [Photobacterium iliopiscarium]|uniref:transposase n=1 Tax=Photobacterium iliopiscarium TaxID=56192 RepID=UPI001E46B4C4|nr:transposase [Photobacterium iliopiscarium]
MKKARTTYSVEFKHAAANLVLNKGYTIQEACNTVGVGYTAMSRWVSQLKQEHGGITPTSNDRFDYCIIKRASFNKTIM